MKPAGTLNSWKVPFTWAIKLVLPSQQQELCAYQLWKIAFSHKKIYQNTHLSNARVRSWVWRGKFLMNACPSLISHEKIMTQLTKVDYILNKYFEGEFLRDTF